MNHRREIDGLRAFAVVPVILYHAGVTAIPGGFLGVDIFFVISGYLISGLLQQTLQQNRFSLRQFYARRARRILPALCLVMLACVPVAYFTMLPSQYEEFARSMPAVLLFVSNLFFWRESGYFAAAAAEKPLLHTWSLGVEEQFYLFFPLLLLLLWRWRPRTIAPILIFGVMLSLAAAEYASRYAINANFFLITSRAWELLLGALLVYLPAPRPGMLQRLLGLVGLILLPIAMIVYDDQMRLPSALGLPVVLGTALVLRYATEGSLAAQILRLRAPVAIGLISYSAYLWHQPLFAFARIYFTGPPSDSIMLGLITLTFALAALSWRFVEQPFRIPTHPHYVANRRAKWLLAGASLLLVIASAHGYFTEGRVDAWKTQARPEQVRAFELVEASHNGFGMSDNGECIFHDINLTPALEKRILQCRKKYGAGVAVIGDSHAVGTFEMLRRTAGDTRFLVGIAKGMCRPHHNFLACPYTPFATLLAKQPGLFRDVIYEQAGFHLLRDTNGKDMERQVMMDVPLSAPMPTYTVNSDYIAVVRDYLLTLAPYTRVTWLGPHTDPQIGETLIIARGCAYPFALRPGQEAQYDGLETAIQVALKSTPIHYRSKRQLMQFMMQRDFMHCDVSYWRDSHHFSHEGEAYFAKRVTLLRVLNGVAHE